MEATDDAIVGQVVAGDTEAFRCLVDRHSKAVYRLAYRMTGNQHDAEDIVQETFIRAYRRLDRFESRASFSTWLHRIGTNCSLDVLRSRKSSILNLSTETESQATIENVASERPTPEDDVLSTELRDKVDAAMDGLSTVERTAFVLRHHEEMPLKQIGEVLGINENAVKNTVFRAVRKIRRALEPVMGELR